MRNARVVIIVLALAACSGPPRIDLHYSFSGIAPADVVRVETFVDMDASDGRMFFADQPFRQVAIGVGYEVRDVDGSGRRRLVISHDATLGYDFSDKFVFTLLPPVDGLPPMLVADANAAGTSQIIGKTAAAVTADFKTHKSVDVVIADRRCGDRVCNANEACCSGTCASIQDDAANCGMCGKACGMGETCQGGVCGCAGGSACSGAQRCCPSLGCVDINSDSFHCGDCAHACAPGEMCAAGACQCNGMAACTGAVPLCCPAGGSMPGCSPNGSCSCGGSACNAPNVCCGGTTCVDLTSSQSNCGACGRSCANGFTCQGGNCLCSGTLCGPSDSCCGDGCHDLMSNHDNCGACGHACGAGEVCSGGMCQCGGGPGCTLPSLCCGTTCIDVSESTAHCGSCDNACITGEKCNNGACSCQGGAACVGNQTCCSGSNGGTPGCFDLSNDPQHCGTCDTPCGAQQACVGGHCVNTTCVPACTNGNTCVGTTCMCGTAPACSPAQTCCPATAAGAGGCFDLMSDPNNCGACGKKVRPVEMCCAGAPVAHDGQHCANCTDKCSGLTGTCCKDCGTPGYHCGLQCIVCL